MPYAPDSGKAFLTVHGCVQLTHGFVPAPSSGMHRLSRGTVALMNFPEVLRYPSTAMEGIPLDHSTREG
jgi:hypothetical protein